MLIPRMISENKRNIKMRVFGACWVYDLVAPMDNCFRSPALDFNLGSKWGQWHSVKYVTVTPRIEILLNFRMAQTRVLGVCQKRPGFILKFWCAFNKLLESHAVKVIWIFWKVQMFLYTLWKEIFKLWPLFIKDQILTESGSPQSSTIVGKPAVGWLPTFAVNLECLYLRNRSS